MGERKIKVAIIIMLVAVDYINNFGEVEVMLLHFITCTNPPPLKLEVADVFISYLLMTFHRV